LAVGFWGERTASVDWCEHNYIHSYFIAEFWNTLSSLIMTALGILGCYHSAIHGFVPRIFACYIGLGLIGLGSAAFHATLLHTGQALDELPMIYVSLLFIYCLLMHDKKSDNILLSGGLLLYSTVFTIIYFYIPSLYAFFLLSYAVLVLFLAFRSYFLMCQNLNKLSHTLFWTAIISYGFAFFGCWLPENIFCNYIRFLQLHSWWHVFAGLGTYTWIVFITFETYSRSPLYITRCFNYFNIVYYISIVRKKQQVFTSEGLQILL